MKVYDENLEKDSELNNYDNNTIFVQVTRFSLIKLLSVVVNQLWSETRIQSVH